MLRVLLAALLFIPLVASAQPADSLVTLPRYHRTVQGNFRPPQTSAARAYLYSATATGVPVLLGTATLLVATPTRPSGELSPIGIVGTTLILSGVLIGPSVGNMTLGAGETVERGIGIMLVGMKVGSGMVVAGAGTLVLSVVTGPDGLSTLPALVLVAGGAAVFLGGFLVAGAYNMAMIPANARWAQRARANGNRVPASQVRVSVAPGYDPRFDAPMATVRVAL